MIKLSSRREAILNAFRGVKTHPTAIEIFDILRQQMPGTTLATIYRNIHALEQAQLLHEVHVGDGSVHYDAIIEPHCHISCKKCGRVEDISAVPPDEMINKVEQECEYTDIECNIIFTGICKYCNSQEIKS